MLILGRRIGEVIQIGKDVRVVLVRDGHGRTRIGVDAPDDTLVMREELLPSRKNLDRPETD